MPYDNGGKNGMKSGNGYGMKSATMPDKHWNMDAGYVKSADMKYSNADPAKELKKNADALASYVNKNKANEY